MAQFTAMLIVTAALFSNLVVEVSAELWADALLDVEAGAVVDFAPGQPTQVVDLSPRASIRWPQ